jgi:hypothetical protein
MGQKALRRQCSLYDANKMAAGQSNGRLTRCLYHESASPQTAGLASGSNAAPRESDELQSASMWCGRDLMSRVNSDEKARHRDGVDMDRTVLAGLEKVVGGRTMTPLTPTDPWGGGQDTVVRVNSRKRRQRMNNAHSSVALANYPPGSGVSLEHKRRRFGDSQSCIVQK